ncbi:MAG: hypothetical protein WDW38_003039 [Sanguina aurantia]
MTHHALRPSGEQHIEHATDAQPSRHLQSAQLGGSIDATNTTKRRSNAYVGICAIVKNEQRNIQEWIDYHHWIGVGKFYIYDHGSSLSVAAQLQKYIAAGIVEVFTFASDWQLDAEHELFKSTRARSFLSPQAWAADSCFRWFGYRHTFLGMLDTDEFVVLRNQSLQTPMTPPSLPAFLKGFEPYAGVLLHWQMFGSSGLRTRPSGGTLASYTACMDKNATAALPDFINNPVGHMKSFTQTQHFKYGCNPHMCAVGDMFYVNEDFTKISRVVARQLHWQRAVVHHYATRSAQEYSLKLARGSGHSQYSAEAMAAGIRNRGWGYFKLIDHLAKSQCTDGVDLSSHVVAAVERGRGAPGWKQRRREEAAGTA